MADLEDRQIVDPGIEQGIKDLTPERIQKVINSVLSSPVAGRIKLNLQSCVHCALCADSCHTYLSRDRDPDFAPVAKVKDTLLEMIKRKGKVSPEFIKDAARIAYTECGGCRRCSMYCPFGIDIATMIMQVRRICSLLGVVPQYIQDTTNSHSATSNQMWVQQDDLIDTLLWQEEDAQLELAGLRIPLDKEGAEVMYSVIAPEPKVMAQLIANMAVVMNVAKVDWTMLSTDGWDNSNMAMFSGDLEMMGRVEREHWERALDLKVKKVVMGECGHAYRGAVYDGPKWLGWQGPPLPMVHAVEFYYDLLQEGRIKITSKETQPVTIQDPCNIARGCGLHDKLRTVVHALCEDVREMAPRNEHNYCCAAGGGVINCGAPWKKSRLKSIKIKADQLRATESSLCITPCHNCHHGVEDVIDYYKLGMKTSFIIELLVKHMEMPEA